MSKIIVCVGAPGSGKTYWAQQYCRADSNFVRINADLMRGIICGNESDQTVSYEAFQILEKMSEYLLKEGKSLVSDNLGYNKKNRKIWVSLAKKYNCVLEAVVFDTPLILCLERNAKRDRVVPEEVIFKAKNKLELPTKEEGFHNVTTIKV